MKLVYCILTAAAALLCGSCMQSARGSEGQRETSDTVKTYEYMSTVRLTVSESKRLIAKGISMNKEVRERLENGMVIITLGTTNTYIAEELAGLDAPRGSFVTGRIFPSSKEDFAKDMERRSEIVLLKGKPVDMSYEQALAKMHPEDIVFKGANMVNYANRYKDVGKGKWIVPVGLEKETSQDLFEVQKITDGKTQRGRGTVRLSVTQGNIYTEIEAVKELADVDVFVTAKGGVDGAEGGVSLLVCGKWDEVSKVENLVKQLAGEPPFVNSEKEINIEQ